MTSAVFDSIWLPLQAQFYRLAFYILEDEQEAEDAVQDLYVKLWDRRMSLDEIENPKAYGLHLLRNSCLDRIRSRTRHRSSPLEDFDCGSPDSPEGKLESRQQLAAVREAIEQLPQKQRRLLTMKVFDEMDYEQIARQTGLTQVNIRVTVALARKTLRNKIKMNI